MASSAPCASVSLRWTRSPVRPLVNGLFNGGGTTLLIAQLEGIVAVAVYTLVASFVFWYAIKALLGLRVSKEEEEEGLDIGEHGQVAYTGFVNSGYGV
jgi:ammonium transporter, Amt family